MKIKRSKEIFLRGTQYNAIVSFPWGKRKLVNIKIFDKQNVLLDEFVQEVSPEILGEYEKWIPASMLFVSSIIRKINS